MKRAMERKEAETWWPRWRRTTAILWQGTHPLSETFGTLRYLAPWTPFTEDDLEYEAEKVAIRGQWRALAVKQGPIPPPQELKKAPQK